jgi:hypothetical protein
MGNHEQPEMATQEVGHILCSVYGLYSSEDGEVRYIGQTKQPLASRLTQHLAEAHRSKGNSRAHRWIKKAVSNGFTIGIQLIEANCQWNEAERRWIAVYRAKFPGIMTNLSDGGCGYAGKRSLETRAKMRGPKSEAHKAKMRKKKTAETRERISKALIGNDRGVGEKNYFATLTAENVIEIKTALAQGESLSKIAARYGVLKGTISKIKTGRTWAHLAA